MRYLLLPVLLALALAGPLETRADSLSSSGGVTLQDEGTPQGRVQNLNCVGSTIACTKSGPTGTVTITGGGGGYDTVEDEGTPLTQRTTINFTGSGISCSDSGGKTVCNASGGVGSANTVAVTVDFGATGASTASTVVTGQTWVTGSSVIVCSPTMMATADRTDGMEDAMIEGLTVAAYARVAGTGFTVAANPSRGKAYKKFLVHCTGA